jgi:prolyl-tRNA synthetase
MDNAKKLLKPIEEKIEEYEDKIDKINVTTATLQENIQDYKDKSKVRLLELKNKKASLEKDYLVELDLRDISPGEKYNHWELKGVPVRLELGPKDLEKNQVVLVKRTDKKKEFVSLNDLSNVLSDLHFR